MGGKRKERGSGGCERAIEEKREVSNGSGGKDDGRNGELLELGNGRGKLY